jgi:PAS domain S-box-containing protein
MNKAKIASTAGTRKAGLRRHRGSNGAVPNGNGARGDRVFVARQTQLEQVITQTPAMLTRCTRDLRYRYVSRAYAKMLGYTAKEIAGKPIVEIIGKKALKVIGPYVQKVLKGQQAEYEQIVPFAGIGNRHLHTIYIPDRDEAGNVIGWIASIVDITERKWAEELVRENERRFREMIDALPAAVYTTDAQGRLTHFNQACVELSGRVPELGTDRWCVSWKLYHPDGRRMPHGQCPMAIALKTGRVVHGAEAIAERPDGSRIWFAPYPTPLRDARGRVVGGINMLVDITERKRAEIAAMRLAAVVRSSHDAIAAKDLNGIITDWNQSAERIFGYKAKEIIGKSVLTLIPKDRQSEETKILRKIRRGESIDHYQTVRRRKDGRLVDVSLTISPVKDAKGKIVGVSKVARDITNEKQTERRLAEQARLLDLSNEAILVRDSEDRITYWNRGAEEMYGYSHEEALGKVTHRFLRTELPKPLGKISKELRRAGRWSGELIHRRKDGRKIVVMSNWALDQRKGRRAYVLESNSDITQRKHAEVALERSKAMLEKLVDQRTRALRSANTELENEIRRRKGLEGQILEISDREQERLGQELHDGLCQQLTAVAFMARAAALRLKEHRVADPTELDKIAKLINTSVTDARNIAHDLHKEEIDAAEFEHALRDLAERKIWQTRCRFHSDAKLDIQDDRVASEIFRILREGVINANKHARAREIVLEACRRKRELVFSVTDNGIGLNGQNKKPNGGLGFHIMKYRAQSIGARLEVESLRRGGTRLSVRLPLAR